MSINAGTVYSELLLDTSKYLKGLKQAEEHMNKFTTKLKSAGDKMQSVGKSLTTKLTLPIAAAGGASINFAVDFEKSLNKVSTIADTNVKSIDQIEEGIIGLSDEVKVASTELSEALYQTISATGDTANALDYVEIASKAAKGGFTDSATAVDGLTTVLNAYGLKGSEAMQKVSDQMLMAQNYGKTTFGEMASSIGNVIPIASSLNVSTEELFGSIATLTKNGIQTSQAITGLKAAYSNILKPSKEAGELAANLGLEFNAAHLKSVGWAGFLEEIKEKTGGNSEQLATLFGSVEALNSVTVLATTGSEDFAGALDAMGQSAGATEKAFAKMDQGTKASFEDIINKSKNLGIELAKTLLPTINKLLDKVSDWIDKFRALDDGTKETIVKIAGLAAAIGPILLIGGKVVTLISGAISAFSTISGAIAVVTTGATAATPAIGALASVFTVLTGPVGLAIAGIAAVTAGGVALYKHLSQDAIPAVDLFGDEVSESTKEAVGGFLELNDKATLALDQLNWSGQTVTEEMAEKITGTFDSMKSQIVESLDEQHKESLSKMQEHFANSTALTEEEEAIILEKMQVAHQGQIMSVEMKNMRIQEIMKKASEDNRELTKEEQEEINSIQQDMVETGIKTLSENEVESKAIMERMKAQAGEISATQAAEVVKNSLEQKEGAIQAAEEQYNEVVKEIIRQRDESGIISAEQADKLIEEATRQRDETIDKATEMHNQVIEQAKLQAGEHVDEINWETGEILSKWEVFKNDVSKKMKQIKEDTIKKVKETKEAVVTKYEELKMEAIRKIEEKKEAIIGKWRQLKEDAGTWATNMMNMFIDNIRNKINAVKEAVSNVAGTIKDFLGFSSPTKLGPASDSDKWMPNMVKMFADGINNNSDKVKNASNNLAEKIKNSMDKVNDYVDGTVGIIEKQFKIWVLKNNEVSNSSKYLEKQLEMQKQKHELLNEQISATENALATVVTKYGEGSEHALEYKNKLLDLQIVQANLAKDIQNTTSAMHKQIEAQSKLEVGDGWFKVGNVKYDTKKERKKYKEKKDKDFEKYGDEIESISERQGVDYNVAYDMWKQNKLDEMMGKVPGYALGTSFHYGGLAWVGEQGPELIELPRASKVYNNQKSIDMVNSITPMQQKAEVHLHIGTLVADDYGLKQLERKLSDIRIGEKARLGVNME